MNKKNKIGITRLSLDIPEEVHCDFKIVCTAKKVTMKEYLLKHIKKIIKKHKGT